jgi:ribosomal protein L7/L12
MSFMSRNEQIAVRVRLSRPDGELVVTENRVQWRWALGKQEWPVAALIGVRVVSDAGQPILLLQPRWGAAERITGFRAQADAECAELAIITRLWHNSTVGQLIEPLPAAVRRILSAILAMSERMYVTVVGDGMQTMIATDRRLIVIKPRLLGHPVIGSYPYARVERVDFFSPGPRVAGSIVVAAADAPAPPSDIAARRWAPNILTFSDGGHIPVAARRIQELTELGHERAGARIKQRDKRGPESPHLLLAVAEQLQQIDERRARGELAPGEAEIAAANVAIPFDFGPAIGLAPAGEHSTADVLLIFAGPDPRKTARRLSATTGLPLSACHRLVNMAPAIIRHAIPEEIAEQICRELQEGGAQVEVVPRLSPGGSAGKVN